MDLISQTLAEWLLALRLTASEEATLAAVVSALATLLLILTFSSRLPLQRREQRRAGEDPARCEFRIIGTSLKPLTEPARVLLASLGPAPSRLAALTAWLARDCDDLQPKIEALILYGTAFRALCRRPDGSACEIVGQPRDGAAVLSIGVPSEDARALEESRGALTRVTGEARFLREIVDHAPVLAWSVGADGHVDWANAAYRDRFDAPREGDGSLPDHRIADAFAHVLEQVPLTARDDGTSRRLVSVPGREAAGEPHWFEVSQCPGEAGATLGFALDADSLVAAEASLRRFVETLTETFAHLPIGLAVFDKNRRLGLFNPALTDLVKIDAVWLAGRPSLRDFLERLRETRQMPEQKDFTAWRRKLTELEEGARDGTYEENWVLPSGKIFRVTGRPHPQGALAFLFEDISTAIQLERRYRSELELSQATLDRLSEAVAVFDASGTLVFVNNAFVTLWSLDPMDRLEGPGVVEMTGLWAGRCAPSSVWAELAEFATGAEARASWTASIETLEARCLEILVAPLPDASSLVVFRDMAAPAAAGAGTEAEVETPATADPILGALALEQLEAPVEAAIRQVMAAIPAAQSPGAFQALGSAAQGLRDALTRARELRALGVAEPVRPTAEVPLPALATALDGRGMMLVTPAGAQDWPPVLRRAAIALGLAAADRAGPGAEIRISLEATPEVARLTVTPVPALAGRGTAEGPGFSLARHVVEAAGGSLAASGPDAADSLVAELPTTPAIPATAEVVRAFGEGSIRRA